MTEAPELPPYRLVRSKRRTLAITLDERGEVTVRAPLRMPLWQVSGFLAEKTPWILSKRAMLQSRRQAVQHSLTEGSSLPFLGGSLIVAYTDRARPYRAETILYLPRNGDPAAHALRWFTESAVQALPPIVEKWAGRMNVFPASVAFGHARKRWGSMSSAGALRLNVGLLHCAPPLIDYVVVHELAHRVHPNHSKAFHAYVESVLPGAGQLRSQIKEATPYLELLRTDNNG